MRGISVNVIIGLFLVIFVGALGILILSMVGTTSQLEAETITVLHLRSVHDKSELVNLMQSSYEHDGVRQPLYYWILNGEGCMRYHANSTMYECVYGTGGCVKTVEQGMATCSQTGHGGKESEDVCIEHWGNYSDKCIGPYKDPETSEVSGCVQAECEAVKAFFEDVMGLDSVSLAVSCVEDEKYGCVGMKIGSLAASRKKDEVTLYSSEIGRVRVVSYK